MHAILEGARIIQNAYVVDDLQQAMKNWNQLYGIGPFTVIEHIRPTDAIHRGSPVELDFSAAFVQSGELNIELIEQHNDSDSAFRDMYTRGQQGFHHIAIIADDFAADVANFESAGYPVATQFTTGPNSGIAFIDTRPLLGHMIELYQNKTAIMGLYGMVREAADSWDGETLVAQT